MKTTMVIVLSVLLSSFTTVNDERYLNVMKKNIDAVYKAQSMEELRNAVNTFERIGSTEKTKWEPFYYASFGYIMMANAEQSAANKDAFLDQATNVLNKAKEIAPAESEVIALEGFIHMMRVTVDPATRGPQFAPIAMKTFGKAIELNPDNPRALALMAQMQFGTAQFLGSPVTEACATVELALQKFKGFTTDSPVAPQWGKAMAEELKKQCN